MKVMQLQGLLVLPTIHTPIESQGQMAFAINVNNVVIDIKGWMLDGDPDVRTARWIAY